MHLYQITAAHIKSVSPLLKIGGPAVSSFNDHDARRFLTRFLEVCADMKLPVDFVSAHPYPASYFLENGKLREILLGSDSTKNDIVWMQNLVSDSAYPVAEIHLDEWNTSARDRDIIHDTAFMANFVLHNYLSCGNLANSLCYWALSDRFEEHGLGSHEFHGGFGLLSVRGLKKPQYYAFQALKRLGDTILAQGDDHIVTYSCSGENETEIAEIQALCWNYVHYNEMYAAGTDEFAGSPIPDFFDRYQVFEIKRPLNFILNINTELFGHCRSGVFEIEKTVFNRENGSIFDFWLKNGAIENFSDEQRNLMSVQCIPKQNIAIQRASSIDGHSSTLALSETVEPFGFVFFRIRPLAATE
jgi:xylan 1,4-beta-xylosidase